jgi:hypothetical protein
MFEACKASEWIASPDAIWKDGHRVGEIQRFVSGVPEEGRRGYPTPDGSAGHVRRNAQSWVWPELDKERAKVW